jgi:antitoxin MazE
MEVPMQVSKWGNSLAVRLPAKLVEELGLKEGDEIELVRKAPRKLEVERQVSARELLDDVVRRFSGRMPAGYKFDRDEANRRGRAK